jgi:hypothetical protein
MPGFKKKALKLIREFMIIFAGVVLALSGENYMEYLNDRVSEKNYLHDFLEELESSRYVYEDDRRRYYGVDSAAMNLITIAVTGDVSNHNPCKLVQNVTQLIEPDIYNSVYDEIKSSGNLDLIQSRELRIYIVQYYQRQMYEQKWAQEVSASLFHHSERNIIDLLTVDEFSGNSPCDKRRILKSLSQKDIIESLGRARKVAIVNGASLEDRIEYVDKVIGRIKEELSEN